MAHSLSKNWLHLIFSTKNHTHLITSDVEQKIYPLIRQEVKNLGCFLAEINGMPDHTHLLLLLHPSKALADVVKQIKGASAYHINQNDWMIAKFGWQKGYGAFSVSESQLYRVQKYIQGQKKHHKKLTFMEEYQQFLKLHGLERKVNG